MTFASNKITDNRLPAELTLIIDLPNQVAVTEVISVNTNPQILSVRRIRWTRYICLYKLMSTATEDKAVYTKHVRLLNQTVRP